MIAMPIGLAICLTKCWKLDNRIWWVGAATFVLSQVGHIPFNWLSGIFLNQTSLVAWNPTAQLIFNAVFLGLSAGVFEEGARYLVLRQWAKDARSWRKGVLFGAGHGGAEAIILGALALYSFIQLAALRNTDLSKVIPANQLALAQKQMATYWSLTWYYSLFGALERFLAIPIQIALAVIVMQVFIRNQNRWLFLAIFYHALSDASSAVFVRYFGVYWTEAIVGAFAILSVILILILHKPEPPEEILPATTKSIIVLPEPVDETPENLEKTRYQ